MITQLGPGVSVEADAASASLALPAFVTLADKAITVYVKFETSGVTVSDVQDTAGNTYVVSQLAHPTGGEPIACRARCERSKPNAANVITINFTGGTATFRRSAAGQWDGLRLSDLLAASSSNTGSGTSHSIPSYPGVAPGLIAHFLAGFTSLSGLATTSDPPCVFGFTLSDAFVLFGYSPSVSANIVAASSVLSGNAKWVMLSEVLREITAPTSVPPEPMLHEKGIPNTALRDVRAWF